MTYFHSSVSVVVATAWLLACASDPTSGPDGGAAVDAGAADSGRDAGPADAGPADAGALDVGPPDVGSPDAGDPDAGGGALAPGAACDCDADCEGTSTHPGLCVQGICMTRSSSYCSEAGSAVECLPGSRCWGMLDVVGGLCWPDCASYHCDGTCDSDGSCVPDETSTCVAACSEICTEPVEVGPPPDGPPPDECRIGSMGILDWQCSMNCDEIVTFEPRRAAGYWDYPLNGETEENQYRSFVRRDVMMLVRYATAMVACAAAAWDGNGGDLGLGDMSEADGSIPGTSVGFPGHPPPSHQRGRDIDVAYFQAGTHDNRLRPVCPHWLEGVEQYHCTDAPTTLDVWRTALFIGHLHASPDLVAVGVDGRIGPRVTSALDLLCVGGWVSGAACAGPVIRWETTDTGHGWFRHHHHHLHVSLRGL